MKKYILLSISLIVSFSFINFPKDYPKVKGYYIDSDGKRNEVMIQVKTKFLSEKMLSIPNQNGIVAFTKSGKEFSINYRNATEFGFSYLNVDYIYQLFPQELIDKNPYVTNSIKFFRLLQDGFCKVYLFEFIINQGSSSSEREEYILKRNDELFISHSGIRKLVYMPGEKKIEEFFADCPLLLEKIKNKGFIKGDEKYLKYAEFYNTNCAKSDSEKNSSEDE